MRIPHPRAPPPARGARKPPPPTFPSLLQKTLHTYLTCSLSPPHPPNLSSADARAAWKKLEGLEVDGRPWAVDWATKKDLDFMGWAWREGDGEGKDGGDGGAYGAGGGGGGGGGRSTRTASPAPMRDHSG